MGIETPLWLIVLLFMAALLIGIFIGFTVDERMSSKVGNEIKYECPVLFEQGVYLFVDGKLISPSGKKIVCKEVGEKENCTRTEMNYCATECYENERLIPCENFSGDEHFCNEGICEANGGCPNYFERLEGKTLFDCIKEVEEFSKWNATKYIANRFPTPEFVNTTRGKENE